MEKPVRKSRILVAPLDWGLGHATRCIPIIRELLARDVDVWLAGESPQKDLLQQEFPGLPLLPLEGYRVKYARTGIGMLLSIFRQTQKILSTIKKENEWLKKIVAEHEFDAVISDNRYGLHHPDIPCIFITHQLTIKSPLGKWTEKIVQKKNYQYINRFTECWVPDTEGVNNLAGILSHPQKKPAVPVCYIGSLSRFQITNEPLKNSHLLIILSGPEPQRNILENKIIQQIAHYPSTATIVRGLPGSDSLIPSTGMIKFYNHLPADDLNKEMEQAEYIISRSGYSTVMDLVKLKKKSILIPTPGQTEQEYLAEYLSKKQIAFCVPQKDFSLATSIKIASQFSYQLPSLDSGQLLEPAISRLISSLNQC
jgi:uncharacterized protein (TIGR00661 family)